MKTRVTAVSSRYPAQNVEWILFFNRIHSSSIKTEILVFLGNFYLFLNMLLWPDPRSSAKFGAILKHIETLAEVPILRVSAQDHA